MKRLILLFIIPFFTLNVSAQTKTQPVITQSFTDSLASYITKIAPPNCSMSILYRSPVSAEGKLTDPKIMRQEDFEGTAEDNDFVVKLRKYLLQSPAWKPATDETSKAVPGEALFRVIIKKGKITIGEGNGKQ